MSQTKNGLAALERCFFLCEWHLHRLGMSVGVYAYPYHTPSGGSHHLLRRKVDDIRAILGLCGLCHSNHHSGKSPTTKELAQLMREVHGYDLWVLWTEFIKPE